MPAQIETGKFVLLNMDAPHHTHLRKIISRAFTPRAVEPLRDDLPSAPSDIAKAAAAEGSGDFVEQVSCELPLQAIAGLMGVPQEDRKKLFHWSNQMVGDEDPEFASNDATARVGRTDHVRHADGRRPGRATPATTSSPSWSRPTSTATSSPTTSSASSSSCWRSPATRPPATRSPRA